MSAVLKSVASAASKIVSPGFYVQQYHAAINFTRLADKNGNAIKPFFIGMTLVGLTGKQYQITIIPNVINHFILE